MSFFATYGAVTLAGAGLAAGVVSSRDATARANTASKTAVANEERRYGLESEIAEQQIDEQQIIAREAMTDVTRQFLSARGTMKAVSAESGVTGKTAQRLERISGVKESEAKGKIARDIDTNVVNLAQGMLASKINSEATIMEANNQRVSSGTAFVNAVGAGISGVSTGLNLANSISKIDFTPSINIQSASMAAH